MKLDGLFFPQIEYISCVSIGISMFQFIFSPSWCLDNFWLFFFFFLFSVLDSRYAIPQCISKLFNPHKTFVLRYILRNRYETIQLFLWLLMLPSSTWKCSHFRGMYRTCVAVCLSWRSHHRAGIVIVLIWKGISNHCLRSGWNFFTPFFLDSNVVVFLRLIFSS